MQATEMRPIYQVQPASRFRIHIRIRFHSLFVIEPIRAKRTSCGFNPQLYPKTTVYAVVNLKVPERLLNQILVYVRGQQHLDIVRRNQEEIKLEFLLRLNGHTNRTNN